MRWSDTTWPDEYTVSATTEYKGVAFRVTIRPGKTSAVQAEIIDRDGSVRFCAGISGHRYIEPALRAWVSDRWMQINPDRCFDWFPDRAMRFGLDTVLAQYDAELKQRAKARKESRGLAASYHNVLSERFSTHVPAHDAPAPDEAPVMPGPRRIRKIGNTQQFPPRLLEFDGPTQLISLDVPDREPAGAYDRLMRDRAIRWEVYMYVCEQLSGYRERRDNESFQRFLALINSFWALGGVRFESVSGNPDAVTVDIWPNWGQAKARMTLDLKGIV